MNRQGGASDPRGPAAPAEGLRGDARRGRPTLARRIVFAAVPVLVLVVLPFLALEWAIDASLSRPAVFRHLPAWMLRRARAVYDADRAIIQFEPACARYDADLFYTLRPGEFEFANREFRTAYRVNSLGVRAPEGALDEPEILVAGDSTAMGWGVEEERTFAALLGVETGLRVLNMGVSSYGTAREMRLLRRVDTSRARCLVVQYSDNDAGENLAFELTGNQHIGQGEEAYRGFVEGYLAQRRYRPGRRIAQWLRGPVERPVLPPPWSLSPEEEARWFLNALCFGSDLDLRTLPVIVFDPSRPNEQGTRFLEAVRAVLRREPFTPFAGSIALLDVAPLLGADDFLTLDGHLNDSGHRKVAAAILALMNSRGVVGPAAAAPNRAAGGPAAQ